MYIYILIFFKDNFYCFIIYFKKSGKKYKKVKTKFRYYKKNK